MGNRKQIRSGSSLTRSVYKNKAWEIIRERIIQRDCVCQICGKSPEVEVVDHIIELTDANYTNPDIAFGDDNLQLLCHPCHRLKTDAYQTGRMYYTMESSEDIEARIRERELKR